MVNLHARLGDRVASDESHNRDDMHYALPLHVQRFVRTECRHGDTRPSDSGREAIPEPGIFVRAIMACRHGTQYYSAQSTLEGLFTLRRLMMDIDITAKK